MEASLCVYEISRWGGRNEAREAGANIASHYLTPSGNSRKDSAFFRWLKQDSCHGASHKTWRNCEELCHAQL